MSATGHPQTGSVPASAAPDAPPARVGPNAVIQLAAALTAHGGPGTARQVFAACGLEHLLADPPQAMVDQALVQRLFRSLYRELPRTLASTVAADAGRRTADYLLANRIPRPAQAVLRRLPPRLSARLLLAAVGRNAWTFAGSGHFTARSGDPCTVTIAGNPIAMPGCPWHAAVFARLFEALVSPGARVVHTHCCHDGEPECRFEIALCRQPRRR